MNRIYDAGDKFAWPRVMLFGPSYVQFPDNIGTMTLPGKAIALLALLSLKFNKNVRRSVMAAALWENASEEQAQANLRQLLLRVRRREEALRCKILNTTAHTISTGRDTVSTDLDAFSSFSNDTDQSVYDLCAIYKGAFLQGMDSSGPELQSWIQLMRTSLKDRFVSKVVALVSALPSDEAETVLEALSLRMPDEDDVSHALMQHLIRNDQKISAIHVYERLKEALGKTLSPSLRTIDLYHSIIHNAAPRQPHVDTEMNDAPYPSVLLLKPTVLDSGVSQYQINTANALVEDVTLDLCRLRSIKTIAPFSAWQLSKSDSLAEARNRNIDYVVQFQISPSTDSTSKDTNLFVLLVHSQNMNILWGERLSFDTRSTRDHFTNLVNTITRTLTDHVETLAINVRHQTGVSDAYSSFLMGQNEMKVLELPQLRRARKFYREAVRHSSEFAPALSGIARTLILEWVLLGRTDDKELLIAAQRNARLAIERDKSGSSGYREFGRASLFMGDIDSAISYGTTAEQLAPRHADGLADLADTFVHGSQIKEARTRISAALALNPLPPDEYLWTSGGIEFFAGNYEKALQQLTKMQAPEPAYRLRAACAAMIGDRKSAQTYYQLVMSSLPDFKLNKWLSRLPQRDASHREHYREALLSAGFT